MKRFFNPLAIAVFLLVSFTSLAQDTKMKQAKNNAENEPYKITYNNLKLVRNDYSKVILHAWKIYDNNKLDEMTMTFADTLNAILPDGSIVKGRDNFISAMKTYRGEFSSVISTVHACTTLKSENVPDEEVTVIWGTETAIKKDGTVQKMLLHELWFFNKEGLVSKFYQYAIPTLEKK